MAVTWIKEKYTRRKPSQMGYKPPASGGDQGTKHKTKKKASEALKVQIRATQPKMVLHIPARGKARMVRYDI